MNARILTGVAYLLAWLGLAVVGGWPLAACTVLISWLALGEFRALAATRRVRLVVEAAYPAALLFTLASLLYAVDLETWLLAITGVGLAALLVCFGLNLRADQLNAGAAVSTTMFAIGYCGLLPALIVLLRGQGPDLKAAVLWWQGSLGFRLLAYTLGVTMLADVGGFVAGKAFGRHKFEHSVSPNKTVEGLWGVLFFGALGSLFLGSLFTIGPLPSAAGDVGWSAVGHRVVLGLVLGLASQVADFGSSIYKREAGVKDWGTLFPGHGGMLDRLDTLLVTVPIVFLYARAAL